MPGPTVITPSKTYQAQRRPVRHECPCGHVETFVPPCCTKGRMVWSCPRCGAAYRMDFQGSGTACSENLFKRSFLW